MEQTVHFEPPAVDMKHLKDSVNFASLAYMNNSEDPSSN